MDLDKALRTAEFLVVDTETNGLAGDACELTEVGAVLVGGGELHDRWETLLTVGSPLSRGIQRFTGITQAMVDAAPPAEAMLPDLAEQLRGRVLVAHSASFDRRVLAQAFERAGIAWSDPPVLCTVALARRLHPLARQRRLAPLAESLGIDVEVAHRALADAETCARVFCALFGRLCANAATIADALALLTPARPRRPRAAATDGGPRRRGARRRMPDLGGLTDDPGVYVIRNAEGQPLYVGKSLSVRARARAHFAPSANEGAWTAQAETVEHEPTNSELGALVLESRLVKRLKPPGNARLKHVDPYVYLRCRLDIPYPVLEVAPGPAPGRAVSIGPLRGRAVAVELLEQLNSLFGLRHCGRTMTMRQWPSAYGQMGRCLSPCLNDLDPNVYRRRLDEALGLFTGRRDGAAALLRHIDTQMRAAAADRRYERAAWLKRRRARLRVLLDGLGGVLAASHARPRLVLAEHPGGGRFDAFWLVGGRIGDWGPLGDLDEVAARTAAALHAGDGTGPTASLAPDEVDEARIVATWLDGHRAPALDLTHLPDRARLERFVLDAGATTTAGPGAGRAHGAVAAAAAGPPPAAHLRRGRPPRAVRPPAGVEPLFPAEPPGGDPPPAPRRQRARQRTVPESRTAPDAAMNA
ncbi:MAG: polymerase subunit epsilon [Solirubrobacteraceae bacterium]|nr:polymerase subunit epsilon [Solirubrobacteraceae bacterium]